MGRKELNQTNKQTNKLSLNAGEKHCRMLQGEHSAILSTLIKLPFVIKTFVLSFFELPLKTGFTVSSKPKVQWPMELVFIIKNNLASYIM